MIGALGRVRSRDDRRTLRLARYLPSRRDGRDYPAPAPDRNWASPSDRWLWRLNDRLGCCTITALAHLADLHAYRHREPLTITDRDVEEGYRAISGYDGTPATDRGAQMLSALIYARTIGIGPWKLGAFVRVDLDDAIEVRAAVSLFGGLYVGADLPRRITEQGARWELTPFHERTEVDEPRSLGGHAFAITGYDRTHLDALPWVTPTTISNPWVSLYADEAYALVAESWVSGERPAPNGFDIVQLRRDLEAIGA